MFSLVVTSSPFPVPTSPSCTTHVTYEMAARFMMAYFKSKSAAKEEEGGASKKAKYFSQDADLGIPLVDPVDDEEPKHTVKSRLPLAGRQALFYVQLVYLATQLVNSAWASEAHHDRSFLITVRLIQLPASPCPTLLRLAPSCLFLSHPVFPCPALPCHGFRPPTITSSHLPTHVSARPGSPTRLSDPICLPHMPRPHSDHRSTPTCS